MLTKERDTGTPPHRGPLVSSARDANNTTANDPGVRACHTPAWAELNRVTAMNAKLESLCRELQKENKRQKEESRRSLEAELARREELSAKFTEALAEMRAKLQEGEAKLKRTPENEQYGALRRCTLRAWPWRSRRVLAHGCECCFQGAAAVAEPA